MYNMNSRPRGQPLWTLLTKQLGGTINGYTCGI